MRIVSNTTPLIGLASINRFDLLRQLFHEIYIPPAVLAEAVVKGRDEGGAKDDVLAASWIRQMGVKDRLAVDVLLDELDLGEAETIILAREMNADWVLMDERKGRRKLKQLGMRKIGTVGILLKAKRVGLLAEIGIELERLQQNGFRVSPLVLDTVLREAGER